MNSHELNAEYTKSVIPQLEAIDKQLGEVVESGEGFPDLLNLASWHEDYFIDHSRLEYYTVPENLRYLIGCLKSYFIDNGSKVSKI